MFLNRHYILAPLENIFYFYVSPLPKHYHVLAQKNYHGRLILFIRSKCSEKSMIFSRIKVLFFFLSNNEYKKSVYIYIQKSYKIWGLVLLQYSQYSLLILRISRSGKIVSLFINTIACSVLNIRT